MITNVNLLSNINRSFELRKKVVKMLNAEIINWIIDNRIKRLGGEDRVRFLQALSKRPLVVQRWVAVNLVDWCSHAVMHVDYCVAVADFEEDSAAVTEACKKAFADELAELAPAEKE